MDGKVVESSTFVRGLLWVKERDDIPLPTLKAMLMEHAARL